MATLRGWAPCGMRLPAKVPHGHWKTTTFLAALRTIVAPWVLDGPVDGESFQIYVEKVLLPTPKQGDIVIMDNLGSHRGKSCGPKYSPDLNPIGAGLCQAQACAAQSLRARSVDALWAAIGQLLSAFTPTPCANTSKAQDTPHLKFIPL